ncbi:uncharacterized protein [Drosophila virilis]|uniref:uncharacterized protein n=1 Tax=Drosophila virilis TaxID=7244 RepID=UPI0013963540|nr:uncharacterized protein LOC26531711 [Drosophila virilis]
MYLNKLEFCSLLICNVFALSSFTNRCSPEYCNFAGECRVINSKPSCSCYEEAFQGKYCEQVKNLCTTEKNRCTSKQICVPYVGQTICECSRQRAGADCGRAAPTKLMCSYNVRAIYGAKEYIVLSFEQLGPEPFQITISTPTYMIAHLPRSKTLSSHHTNNLTATLQRLGIRRHANLPYNVARYYVFQAKHFTLGANPLSVVIEHFGNISRSSPKVQTLSLIVHVVKSNVSPCMPRVVFQHCMDPKKPQQVDVERFINIQAIVEERCFPLERMRTQWTIFNFGENFYYFTTRVGEQLLLKIPRYTLWYDTLLSLYPNLLLSVKLGLKEIKGPWVFVRCYINVTARNVVANIAGGHYREINNKSKWLLLDGSKSREPARNVRAPQQLTYTWILSAEDGSNEQYLTFENSNPKLNIPSKILKSGKKNIITLKVANKLVSARTSHFSQTIVVVGDRDPLSVNIECIRNCQGYLYATDQVLHLQALCPACKMPITYIWKLNGIDMKQNKQRLVMKLATDLVGELIVTLNVADQAGKGTTELRLQQLQPLKSGNCVIEPQNGKECVTKFHIRCQNFVSMIQEPLLYTYTTGNIYEDITNSEETFLYLNGNTPLIVRICGFQFPCTFINISFTIEPMNFRGSETLDKHSMVRMLVDGRRQQAFCFLQKLLASPERINDVLGYFRSITMDRTLSVFEMVNTLEIAYKCITFVGVVNCHEAHAMSNILERVILTFNFVREDTEILDMPEATCLDMGMLITNIVAYCMVKKTELARQNLILDYPYNEDYIDWPPFDKMVSSRIKCYLDVVSLVFKIWHTIGKEFTRYIQPEEPFNYVLNNVSYRVEMHNSYAPIEYASNCTSCTLKIPLPTVEAHRQMLGTNDLLIHAWCFESDIFWWAPGTFPPTTAVLAVDILGRNAPYKFKSQSSLLYQLGLRNVKGNTVFLYEQSDMIHNNMIIYRLKLDGQVNMLVHFVNTSASLRVLITMNVEPTLLNLHDKSCIVSKDCYSRTIILKNRCTEGGIAYIAVYKANSFDTAPAHYTFRISAQECSVWDTSNKYPNWMKHGCYPQNLAQGQPYSLCNVEHLSVFSAKRYEIKPFPIKKIHSYAYQSPFSLSCLIFNCLLALAALSLLIIGKLRLRHKKKNLIRVIKSDRDEMPPHTENIIVHLRTGGYIIGSTTANIKLVFTSTLGRYKVVIYQNPISPHLKLNTSCMIRLSDEKVQLPCRLTISHDVSGRYPSWYCRSVQVDDLRHDLSYTFPIHSWIRRAQKIQVSCLPTEKLVTIKRLHQVKVTNGCWSQFKHRFRYYCKFYFINWFMMQPILGPWRFTDESCNIYERTCIWLCKTILTTTMVFCYYRNSTHIKYFEFDQQISLLSVSEFLEIGIGSYFATLIFEFFLYHLILG